MLAITAILGATFAGQAFQLLAPLALGLFPGAVSAMELNLARNRGRCVRVGQFSHQRMQCGAGITRATSVLDQVITPDHPVLVMIKIMIPFLHTPLFLAFVSIGFQVR